MSPSTTNPMKTKIILSLVIAITFVFSEAAYASVLTPGTGPSVPDIFDGCAGCVILATNDTGLVTANFGGLTLTFDLVSAVYTDPNNTFGAGDLDFVYQVTNEASSTDSIERVTVASFTGFQTDVGYNLSGTTFSGSPFATNGTVAPVFVDRMTASTVGFGFAGFVTPGSASYVIEIQTDATTFNAGQASVFGGNATTVFAFAPNAAAVPDSGSSIALLFLSLGALFGVSRCRSLRLA